jgi:hypothetical protein
MGTQTTDEPVETADRSVGDHDNLTPASMTAAMAKQPTRLKERAVRKVR